MSAASSTIEQLSSPTTFRHICTRSSAIASWMSSGKRRSPESKKRSGLNASATSRSCSPPSTSSTGTARGTRSGDPTDGATKSPTASRTTLSTSACQKRGNRLLSHFGLLRILSALENAIQMAMGRSSSTRPRGRVTQATGIPTSTKIVVANARKSAFPGPSSSQRCEMRRTIQKAPVVTTMANARSPHSPAPRRSQPRRTRTAMATRKSRMASTQRAAMGQKVPPSSQVSNRALTLRTRDQATLTERTSALTPRSLPCADLSVCRGHHGHWTRSEAAAFRRRSTNRAASRPPHRCRCSDRRKRVEAKLVAAEERGPGRKKVRATTARRAAASRLVTCSA
jgi:hypothetical protein